MAKMFSVMFFLMLVTAAAEGAAPAGGVIVRRAVVGAVRVDRDATVAAAEKTPPSGVSVVPRQEIGEVVMTPGAVSQLRKLVRIRRRGPSPAWSKMTSRVAALESGQKSLGGEVAALKSAVNDPDSGLAATAATVADHTEKLEALRRGFEALDKRVKVAAAEGGDGGVPSPFLAGLVSLGVVALLAGVLGIRALARRRGERAAAEWNVTAPTAPEPEEEPAEEEPAKEAAGVT